jgi:hypothetical protein
MQKQTYDDETKTAKNRIVHQMQQRLAKGEQNFTIVSGKLRVKKRPSSIQLAVGLRTKS